MAASDISSDYYFCSVVCVYYLHCRYPVDSETALQRVIHAISSWQPYKDAGMLRIRKEGA
ncbi:MAG: hypothetical protein SPE73_09790 [Prevotella sp.]|nr:hypothetical protein [Prevotella sp.]MCI6499749.1 hypothetical protein [Prevotella sp.]MDD6671277.1 hypothetical protein [Prevotella sp.]MDY5086022.1 hypothetical protein [Prevotella sp.]